MEKVLFLKFIEAIARDKHVFSALKKAEKGRQKHIWNGVISKWFLAVVSPPLFLIKPCKQLFSNANRRHISFALLFSSRVRKLLRRQQPLCRHVIKNQHKLQRQIRACSSSTARPAIRDVDYEDNVKTIQIPASAYRTKSEPIRHDTDNGELFKVSFFLFAFNYVHALFAMSPLHRQMFWSPRRDRTALNSKVWLCWPSPDGRLLCILF